VSELPEVSRSAVARLARIQARASESGESQKVRFELKEHDLSMVSEAGEPVIAGGEYSVSLGGGQPNTQAPSIAGTFQVKGTKRLPE
jgi:beta-glucosidase